MNLESLVAIQWDHPGIFGPFVAALTAGVFSILRRKKPADHGAASISSEIKISSGVDEKAVGQQVSKAVREEFAAFREQLTSGQLAPKQPVPTSGDPLKIKAVEFYNAGIDAHAEGETGQAIGHWLDAVNLDPDDADAHSNLAAALILKGEFAVAIEHCNAALRIDPNTGCAHNNLGIALASQGKLDATIEQFNAALRIHPDDAEVHGNLGLALLCKGELDAASEHVRAALRIDPEDATSYYNLGCILARKKDAPEAVTALAKAIELDSRLREQAKSETDYDTIRDDPAFRRLVYDE